MGMDEYLQRIFPGTAEEFCSRGAKAMISGQRMFVITANPEILMHAQNEDKIEKMLLSPHASIVPDGISVVKAMRYMGLPAKERITGVDLAEELLKQAGINEKKVFLFGAKEEVVSALAKKLGDKYPGMIVDFCNGYVRDKDEVFGKIADSAPDLVLVGMGVPAQELLIFKHLEKFDKGVFVGVGGSFDVLSGSKRRAPAFFVKTNTEWLYRIAREPSRLGRFYRNNIKFLGQIKKAARKRTKEQ